MTHKAAIALVGLSLIALEALATFDCSLIESPEGAVSQAGKALSLPLQVANCEGVGVTSGTVIACVQDRRSRLICRSVQAGETVTASKFFPGQSMRGWTLALLDIIRGGETERGAVSRGAEQAAACLPRAGVLLLQESFVIDFNDPALDGIETIEFRQDSATGPVIARVSGVGVHTVSRSRFQRGETYWWRALSSSSGLPTMGSFVVLDAKRLRQAQTVEASLAPPGRVDRAARAVMMAEWLYTEGFLFDAAQTLLAAGVKLAKPAPL